jgi:hypothetical protein
MRLSTLGLVSLIAGAFAAPAFAGTPASISGSATLVTPSGFTSTVSGESILPTGFVFQTLGATLTPAAQALPFPNPNATVSNASVIVVPTYVIGGATFLTNTLSVASAAAVTTVSTASSFSAAAANILTQTAAAAPGSSTLANVDFISAIIKAGAGVNGLD